MVLSAIEDGLSVRQACLYAGISTATFASWKTKYPRIEQRFEEARESARRSALKTIKDASRDDWRAAAEFLRLSFYPNYNNPTANVNVSATAIAAKAAEVTITEEERMRLIAQRQATEHKALRGLQDKPVIEAEIVPEKQQQTETVAGPEPEEPGTGRPEPGWAEKHEKVKQEAARREKEAATERERQQQEMRDAIRIRDLGF
jgi:hypothetical protein